MAVSPLGVLFAIVIIGITIEVVEQQSKQAAYVLVLLILLGMAVFNAQALGAQLQYITQALNAPSGTKKKDTGGGASFR